MSDVTFLYSVFGLTIRSEIALPGLAKAAEGTVPDVVVEHARIRAPESPPGYTPVEAGTLLTVPEAGKYLITSGRKIVVEPKHGISERNVRLYLLGSAMGALLHQRGLLPLHANAIEIGGRAFAFSGPPGAGKSTMAAWFHDRGHRILTDDVCVISIDSEGRALAYPGIARLRLWRDALEASGRNANGYERSFDDMEKFDVPVQPEAKQEPLELAGIYLLDPPRETRQSAQIARISGSAAVEALISNTYRGAYLETVQRTSQNFHSCLQLARAVPAFRLQRLWGFDRFEEQARLVEHHARGLVDRRPAKPKN